MGRVVSYVSTIWFIFAFMANYYQLATVFPPKSPRLCRRFINFMDRQPKPVKKTLIMWYCVQSTDEHVSSLYVFDSYKNLQVYFELANDALFLFAFSISAKV